MDNKTIKSLHKSICKWECIINGSSDDRGATNCDLCKTFHKCWNCPVCVKTGAMQCWNTSYYEFRNRSKYIYIKDIVVFTVTINSLYYAIKMFRLLVSLLPADERGQYKEAIRMYTLRGLPK